MVKYTLDNIEGVIFKYSGEIYKIHKEKGQIEVLDKYGVSKSFYEYSHYFTRIVEYLNDGTYKVIIKPERTIELW